MPAALNDPWKALGVARTPIRPTNRALSDRGLCVFPPYPCIRYRYGAKQAVRLAVDAVGEEEGVGAPVVARDPQAREPKAACRLLRAQIDRDCALKLPGCGSNAWIRLAASLKLPTSRSLPNVRNLGGGELYAGAAREANFRSCLRNS